MVAPGQWFPHSFLLALKLLGVYVHRSTLPQSRFARQLPQRGSRDWVRPIQCAARKPGGCGRFSSPLRNSEIFTFHHSTNDTPSVTPVGRDSSLREGAGIGLVPFIGVLANVRGCGRFSSPLRKLREFYILPFIGEEPGGNGKELPWGTALFLGGYWSWSSR